MQLGAIRTRHCTRSKSGQQTLLGKLDCHDDLTSAQQENLPPTYQSVEPAMTSLSTIIQHKERESNREEAWSDESRLPRLPTILQPNNIHLTRTSTRRDDQPHRLFRPLSCDIRRHFPVATYRAPARFTMTDKAGHSMVALAGTTGDDDSAPRGERRFGEVSFLFSDESSSSSSLLCSTSPVSLTTSTSAGLDDASIGRRRGKRTAFASESVYDEATEKKVARCLPPNSEMPAADLLDMPRRLLTMGAGVKAHPRYHRRVHRTPKSSDDAATPLPATTATGSAAALGPVCSVPIPQAFRLAPPPCAAVPYPWCPLGGPVTPVAGAWRLAAVERRTVETQTTPQSPVPDADTTPRRSTGKRHASRRSSGANQMLSSLKKTFGTIRRAMSADRLPRAADPVTRTPATPLETPCRAADLLRSVPQTTTHRILPTAITSPAVRFQRRRSTSPAVRRRKTPATTASQAGAPLSCNRFSGSADLRDSSSAIRCNVLDRGFNGILTVRLRRSFPDGQFGFFIAKDTHGIYVSRLGSVRSAAALWNVFHVGDRILSVQGVPCDHKTEIFTVRNLVAGQQNVEFLIRPTIQAASNF